MMYPLEPQTVLFKVYVLVTKSLRTNISQCMVMIHQGILNPTKTLKEKHQRFDFYAVAFFKTLVFFFSSFC